MLVVQMLDMFRRDTDPKEYYQYYALPVATLLGGYTFAQMSGTPPGIIDTCIMPSFNTMPSFTNHEAALP